MKTLNLKSSFWGLVTMLFFALFVVSCQEKAELISETPVETQVETQEVLTEEQMSESGRFVSLPKGFENKSEEEIDSYLETLKEEGLDALSENYRIQSFLDKNGVLESTLATMDEGELFSDIDLGTVLSEKQLTVLEDFELDQTTELRCCHWYKIGCWYGGYYKKYRKHCGYWTSSYWYSNYRC